MRVTLLHILCFTLNVCCCPPHVSPLLCACAQVDFVLFSVLKTGKIQIDDPYLAGRHAISVLATHGASLVVNYTVHCRRNDNFATEILNIYKTAIGQALIVDAPPCRTCLRVRRAACVAESLCTDAL